MAQPTAEQSRGFDILIWMEDEGTAKARSYTLYGEIMFNALFPTYKKGEVVDLIMEPDEFIREIPPTCRVGYIHPVDKKVYWMGANPLQ